jgi:hypothetical protein
VVAGGSTILVFPLTIHFTYQPGAATGGLVLDANLWVWVTRGRDVDHIAVPVACWPCRGLCQHEAFPSASRLTIICDLLCGGASLLQLDPREVKRYMCNLYILHRTLFCNRGKVLNTGSRAWVIHGRKGWHLSMVVFHPRMLACTLGLPDVGDRHCFAAPRYWTSGNLGAVRLPPCRLASLECTTAPVDA